MEDAKGGRNRVVVHFKDGKLRKGYTHDFTPASETFHLIDEAGNIFQIKCGELKAIFFVKSLIGKRTYVEKKKFSEVDCSGLRGLKIKVKFSDGEIMRGTTLAYNSDRKGFYMSPLDPESNNERVYVIADATVEVKVGAPAEQ